MQIKNTVTTDMESFQFLEFSKDDVTPQTLSPCRVVYSHPRLLLGHVVSYSLYSSEQDFYDCNPNDVSFFGFLKYHCDGV